GRIILSGGCAQVPGLTDYLASNWGIPVELARPFERIQVADQYAEEVNAAGAALAVAVGLGLRKAGDKGKWPDSTWRPLRGSRRQRAAGEGSRSHRCPSSTSG